MQQTTFAKPSTLNQKWYIVDAKDLVVGRLAARVAMILQGKNKPEYTPHIDTGDFVIILNADKVVITGRKPEQKVYRYHTLYPGGLKETSYRRMQENHPERILKYAIQRMLPKTKMGKQMIKKLHIYAGEDHVHQAQNPEVLDLSSKGSN